ncbi:MAG: hypothetical protein H7144_00745, partial [Burkholderiales bacterium]|nr:hypothetical protein [Phycisphaerae bacterium]
FNCPKCAKPFSVPDSYAGKRARCKGCRTELSVPDPAGGMSADVPANSPPDASPDSSDAPRIPIRVRRLIADAELMRKTFADHPHIRISSTQGDPPELYRIDFTVRSLARSPKGKPIPRETHTAEVQLGADYPRLPPVCKMVTPVFHPNIDESHICIGDHWTAGERLVDLVKRIAEMLAYQAYNIRSPLDGEAAMWADLNLDKIPTDPRPMV